jgi:hypothetical protein
VPNNPAGNQGRVGLPRQDAIVAEKPFTPPQPVSEAGVPHPAAARSYRILRTVEVDAYDTVPSPGDVHPFAAPMAEVPSDKFEGTSRKAAKLSISGAAIEEFHDIAALIATLPAHNKMANHQPTITTKASMGRVTEEKRNVRVRAFLYAASREDDNDFHLIVGRDPSLNPMYLTMELSGLPPASSHHFARLDTVRQAYKDFFGNDLPGTSYDFYDPPIPIKVEGSLFFDMSHATGSRPGPQSLRDDMPVVWEVHPISSIIFEP